MSLNSNNLFTGEEDWDCPLCMEEMDLSDKNFRPCPCGYQVCRFCWHKIREDGNQRCPACRKIYNEDEAEFTPVPQEEINRMRMKKRAIKEKREAAAAAELDMSPAGVALTNEIVNSRRHLCEFRVVQRNLVYVIGISAKIAHEHILKEPEFFGQFGKIIKIVVNKKNFLASSSGSNPPSASAYITFVRKEDAARAIEYVDGSVYDDRVIRATYGTTKYCSYFLRGLTCQNPGCMYLHEPGEDVSSFTKEQLSGGNHNLHSFIVDKSESANLRQFGTILYTAPTQKPATIAAPIPSQTPVQTASVAAFAPLPQSTTPAPSRSQNDSPRSFTPVPAAPPGLKAPSVETPTPLSEQALPEKVPLINELSTNSFFDRISKMVTASELEEFASMAPRGLSFFAPKSPPPPPPALSSFFNFSPLDMNSFAGIRQQAPSPIEPSDQQSSNSSNSSASSCASRQSFSFSNLPIRSPKPSTSPEPPGNFISANSNGPLSPVAPSPIKAVQVDSLFPSDYRPPVSSNNFSAETSNFEANKKFFSTKQNSATSSKSIPVQSFQQSSIPASNNSSPSSSLSSNFQPPSPALKITISGKPIETTAATSSGSASVKKTPSLDQQGAAYTNKNLFDLLQNTESEPVEMPSPSSSSKKTGKEGNFGIGPVKVISSQSMQPQTLADLEKMARENKLESHITGLEETMFRTRLEAESLEAKLKMLFEASAQAKNQRPTAK